MKLRAETDPGSTWSAKVKPTTGDIDRFVRRDTTDDADSASSGVEQQQEASGPYHSVLVEERVWTANWINQYVYLLIITLINIFISRLLVDDAHLNLRTNPIDTKDAQALYKRCQDGILLWYIKI
jgi:hypothetical protein